MTAGRTTSPPPGAEVVRGDGPEGMTDEVASGLREQPAMAIAIAPSMSSNRNGMDGTDRKLHAAPVRSRCGRFAAGRAVPLSRTHPMVPVYRHTNLAPTVVGDAGWRLIAEHVLV